MSSQAVVRWRSWGLLAVLMVWSVQAGRLAVAGSAGATGSSDAKPAGGTAMFN